MDNTSGSGNNGWKIVLIIVGVLAVMSCCCCGGLGWWMYNMAEGPQDISISMQVPSQAKVGETIVLQIDITNSGTQPRELVGVDLYEAYLDGFIVLSSDPSFTGSSTTFGIRSLEYKEPIAPGTTVTVKIELQAVQPGNWSGDIDTMVDSIFSFTTNTAQTVVTPADTDTTQSR